MTKREFVKLKEGDTILAVRHILDPDGKIVVAENSEWRVDKIELLHFKGQGRKPKKTALVVNTESKNSYEITKDNSSNFLVSRKP
jgi:hypothetical protein